MPKHCVWNTPDRVYSVCGNCLTVYTREGKKVCHTFYQNVEKAQKAFIEIVLSYSA